MSISLYIASRRADAGSRPPCSSTRAHMPPALRAGPKAGVDSEPKSRQKACARRGRLAAMLGVRELQALAQAGLPKPEEGTS